MSKSTVYFTNELTPEAVVKMYKQLGVELPGKVAVKVHSGEDGNQNYLHPEFMKPVIDAVHGTVVECNTAYGGARNETPKHIELMKKHRWSDLFDVDIMDAEGPDVEWPVENGKVLKVNYLGKNIENYDSMLVLIHFKGHPMGGYGGALKQLSIGCASSAGKTYIHSGGKVTDQNVLWENCAPQDTFLEAMADAASTVAKHFAGKIAYVAVMKNLSVDCDCCAVAEDPLHGRCGHFVQPGSRCAGPCLRGPGHEQQRPRPRPLYGARQQPPRHPHHRYRRRAGHWQQRVRAGARVTPLPHKTMHPPTQCVGGFLRLCFVCLQSGLATAIQRFYVIFLVEYPSKTALVHVPALAGVAGSRVIDNAGQRFLTMLLVWSIPCGTTLSLAPMLGGIFFGPVGSALVLVLMAAMTIGSMYLASCIFGKQLVDDTQSHGLVMELPPYHKPKWRHILRSSLMKAWDIFWRAFTVIYAVSIAFNVPCTMTVAATYRENHSAKWIVLSIGYYVAFSLAISCVFYHIGLLIW